MKKPLEGITVVEVAMWAFVPSCGAILSDLGANVIKVEPPTGDPLRGLKTGVIGDGPPIDFSWESYNRGKRSITLDLKQAAGREVLMKLLQDADVFLTNILPRARKSMEIDADTIRTRFPAIIYATGSGVGQNGPECEKGGFDAITFWARGSIADTMTEAGAEYPVGPPGPGFGDTLSGSMLAGAICAALTYRERCGESSEVDVSLLGAAMWAMQRYIVQATAEGVSRYPRPPHARPNNVLVSSYRTKDDRFIALCMLQADRYWQRFCELAGREDLGNDPRFRSASARAENVDACFEQMTRLFASRTLAEWCEILAQQEGQWDIVQNLGDIQTDPQVQANAYLQMISLADDRHLPLVSTPMQFNGKSMTSRRSPELGSDSEAILASLGYTEDAIINLKVSGVVF